MKTHYFENFNSDDITKCKVERYNGIRVIRSSLSEINELDFIKPSSCVLARCCRLESLSNHDAMHLSLEACNKIDYESLITMPNLRKLELRSQKVPSFDFIRKCNQLQHLVITAFSPRKNDYSGIIESTSLKTVWITPVRDEVLHELSSNTSLVVTNGNLTSVHGKIETGSDAYYDHTEEVPTFGSMKNENKNILTRAWTLLRQRPSIRSKFNS